MKPRVREVIVVEGRYDKNTVSQVVDADIIETRGFGIFNDSENLNLIKRLAEKRGAIILTDSDGAGFVIRNRIKGAVPGLKQAYIPEIRGREKRKRAPSKEGTLGVEGMTPEVILSALIKCGATFEDGDKAPEKGGVTKADLYALGLSGGKDSSELRARLLEALDLPSKLTANALLEVINVLYTRDELFAALEQMEINR